MAQSLAGHSFPKACRLTASDDFRLAYRSAWRGRMGPFTWHARHNDCQFPRLGMAVPKRVVKRATDRARIKRLIRESFRHHRSGLPAADIVISVKAMPEDLRGTRLRDEIAHIWQVLCAKQRRSPKHKIQ